ncbi:hypothetical protein K503DRAFT_805377 [Rhizopogon vinicolor AM-OR11-026]|uniref:Uncharacterized protein n=1 Tax=Rhizopogon vinicolor AM-OR11-026 TaxID=1314800 RepID=A0A1B7MI46_9AGAM|nr:hypothetical protein K503DRAFT_805377 [Rhizopogon vinicolor AM-OR11-026]
MYQHTTPRSNIKGKGLRRTRATVGIDSEEAKEVMDGSNIFLTGTKKDQPKRIDQHPQSLPTKYAIPYPTTNTPRTAATSLCTKSASAFARHYADAVRVTP